jgi:hypothetical protein
MEKNLINTIEALENTIKEAQELLDVKGDFKLLISKKIEDGILDNLQNASLSQLESLKMYKWNFYDYLNNKKNLDNEIKKRLRLNKINSLIGYEI